MIGRSLFTGCVMVISVTAVVILWLVTASQPLRPALRGNLNLELVETARAKWNNLHVTEYEQTVSFWWDNFFWGTWKAAVVVDGPGYTYETAGHELWRPCDSILRMETLVDPDDNVPIDRGFSWVHLITVDQLFSWAVPDELQHLSGYVLYMQF